MTHTETKNILMSLVVILLILIFALIFRYDVKQPHQEPTKVGFILMGGIHDAGWNASQYEAIQYACNQMGVELLVKEYVRENTGECIQAIQELADEHVGLIFLSSYAYPAEAKDIVKKYPRISFVTNSAEHHARNMTSFFVRMYQVRYLAGAIAGMKTKTGIIGYVAAMPNSAVQRNINAFALGVQRVNPQAKVLVTWTGSWQDEPKEAENARKLVAAGADVLTYHQDEKTVADTARELGVDFIGDHERIEDDSPHNLTSTVCRWEIYYTNILQNYLKGELNAVNNHWLGIGQRTIYLSKYGDAVNEDMQKQTDRLKQELLEGYPIFTGEIYDNQGNLRCAEDETIKDDALLKHINWLVKGVEILE